MGEFFPGAAATLLGRPAPQGAAVERDSARARPRALLPALYRTRG